MVMVGVASQSLGSHSLVMGFDVEVVDGRHLVEGMME